MVRIGELSRRTGVNHRLLRYYEEQGLLNAEREANGYREYDASAVTTVRQIRSLLGAGLNTEIIRYVLPCARGEEPELELCDGIVDTLQRELVDIDRKTRDLAETRAAVTAFLASRAANEYG